MRSGKRESDPPWGVRRVLLLDDSQISLHFEKTLLTMEGFDVRCAQTLADFEAIRESFDPHLILADVRMPDVNGGELCRRLKANIRTRDTPFVLFSAVPPPQLERLALACGADAWLCKEGSGYERLGQRIRSLCEEILW